MLPDYRGGVSWSRSFGHGIAAETGGLFFESNADAVFVSRFGNDFLAYGQTRVGITADHLQFFWNNNLTVDGKRQAWANYAETGPGVRFHVPLAPPAMLFSVNLLRGAYLMNQDNPRKPNFYDVRAGFWYAITH
jgi:hypothetical protein